MACRLLVAVALLVYGILEARTFTFVNSTLKNARIILYFGETAPIILEAKPRKTVSTDVIQDDDLARPDAIALFVDGKQLKEGTLERRIDIPGVVQYAVADGDYHLSGFLKKGTDWFSLAVGSNWAAELKIITTKHESQYMQLQHRFDLEDGYNYYLADDDDDDI